jgi:ribose 5-phosphate isomerase B
MRIYIASDHGGFSLKKELIEYLKNLNYQVEDLGNSKLDPKDDYPDFMIPLAERVVKENALGIIVGRSGNGEAIAANKVKGVRAVVCVTEKMAKKAKEDNNANILSLGADYLNKDLAQKVTKVFLETRFSEEERHARRIGKITSYESS